MQLCTFTTPALRNASESYKVHQYKIRQSNDTTGIQSGLWIALWCYIWLFYHCFIMLLVLSNSGHDGHLTLHGDVLFWLKLRWIGLWMYLHWSFVCQYVWVLYVNAYIIRPLIVFQSCVWFMEYKMIERKLIEGSASRLQLIFLLGIY